jgi:hypothetical protein
MAQPPRSYSCFSSSSSSSSSSASCRLASSSLVATKTVSPFTHRSELREVLSWSVDNGVVGGRAIGEPGRKSGEHRPGRLQSSTVRSRKAWIPASLARSCRSYVPEEIRAVVDIKYAAGRLFSGHTACQPQSQRCCPSPFLLIGYVLSDV